MRAINHSLTGALIGLSITTPELALPIAFASHFVLDAIPHYKSKPDEDTSTSAFIRLLFIDALLCMLLVLVMVVSKPVHWPQAVICAFLAASPDFFSFNHFYKKLKGMTWKPNLYTKFASSIQWFERPIGIVVEAVWLAATIFCLSFFVRV